MANDKMLSVYVCTETRYFYRKTRRNNTEIYPEAVNSNPYIQRKSVLEKPMLKYISKKCFAHARAKHRYSADPALFAGIPASRLYCR